MYVVAKDGWSLLYPRLKDVTNVRDRASNVRPLLFQGLFRGFPCLLHRPLNDAVRRGALVAQFIPVRIQAIHLGVYFRSHFVRRAPLSRFAIDSFNGRRTIAVPLRRHARFKVLRFRAKIFVIRGHFCYGDLRLSTHPYQVGDNGSNGLFSAMYLTVRYGRCAKDTSFNRRFISANFVQRVIVFFLRFVRGDPHSFVRSVAANLAASCLILRPLGEGSFLLFRCFRSVGTLEDRRQAKGLSNVRPRCGVLGLRQRLRPARPGHFLLVKGLLSTDVREQRDSPFLYGDPMSEVRPKLRLARNVAKGVLKGVFGGVLRVCPTHAPTKFRLIVVLPYLLLYHLLVYRM